MAAAYRGKPALTAVEVEDVVAHPMTLKRSQQWTGSAPAASPRTTPPWPVAAALLRFFDTAGRRHATPEMMQDAVRAVIGEAPV